MSQILNLRLMNCQKEILQNWKLVSMHCIGICLALKTPTSVCCLTTYILCSPVESQIGLGDLQDVWLAHKTTFETIELISGITMDVSKDICDGNELIEDAYPMIMTPAGAIIKVPKGASIVCQTLALVMKLVWVVVLPTMRAMYITVVSVNFCYVNQCLRTDTPLPSVALCV